jgi:hypothetical protein
MVTISPVPLMPCVVYAIRPLSAFDADAGIAAATTSAATVMAATIEHGVKDLTVSLPEKSVAKSPPAPREMLSVSAERD